MKIKKIDQFISRDGTIKNVYKTDKGIIELSMIRKPNYPERDVICCPSMYYCRLGCKFCHLTDSNCDVKMVNIEYEELHSCLSHFIIDHGFSNKNLLLSFMGVGEPTLNKSLLLDLENNWVNICNYDTCEITLATMVPSLDRLKTISRSELIGNKKIYISLHTPFTEERQSLIPGSKTTVEEICKELQNYNQKSNNSEHHKNKELAVFHYTLIENVNDTGRHLEEMIKISKQYKIPVKLLRFNDYCELKKSQNEKYKYWKDALGKYTRTSIYDAPGSDIGSSCGQLTKKYYINTEEDK